MRSILTKKTMTVKQTSPRKSVALMVGVFLTASFMLQDALAQTTSYDKYVILDGAGGGTGEYIRNLKNGGGPDWGISFFTGSNRRMTIRQDKIGIGTDNPVKLLHISGAEPTLRLTVDFDPPLLDPPPGTAVWDINGGSSFSISRGMDNARAISIEENNLNVGFGIFNPTARVDASGVIRSRYNTTSNYTEIGHGGTNGYINMVGSGKLDFRTGNTTHMSLTSAGSIGIGTSNPSERFHVMGNAFIQSLNWNNNTHHVDLKLGDNNHRMVSTFGKGISIEDLDGIELKTGSNYDSRLYISNTGLVGIGTNAPTEKLEVAGWIKAEGLILPETTDNNIHYRSTSASTSISGYGNTNMGSDAGLLTTSGSYNSNFGSESGYGVTTGNHNVNIGFEAGYSTGIGENNVHIGSGAGKNAVDMNGNVLIGAHAAEQIEDYGHSVFIGYNAGVTFAGTDLDQNIALQTVSTVSKKSLFVVNNKANIEHPLLFGYFGETLNHDDLGQDFIPGSMSQLGINTHELVDSCALTVKGAVHIGPFDSDPNTFDYDEMIEDYLLWVERGVVSEDFIIRDVEAWDDWPDYVFAEDFKLRSLKELKEYIAKNKHLPGVISQEEVKKTKGYSFKELDKQLLQKVEELTLYTIQQEEKIEVQQAQLDKQARQLELLMAELEKIKTDSRK